MSVGGTLVLQRGQCFLVEGVVLSLLAGVLGIALGLALAALATSGLTVPFVVDPSVFVAFGFSALVGVVYFPARRAARLDPIEAF